MLTTAIFISCVFALVLFVLGIGSPSKFQRTGNSANPFWQYLYKFIYLMHSALVPQRGQANLIFVWLILAYLLLEGHNAR
jgi:hypothetical protein